MSNQLKFFSTVHYNNPSPIESFYQASENYFYYGGKLAHTQIQPGDKNFVDFKTQISLTTQEKSQMVALTFLKVISYFTILIPLIFLLIKAISRASKDFQVSSSQSNPIKDFQVSSSPSNPITDKPQSNDSQITNHSFEHNRQIINVRLFSLTKELPSLDELAKLGEYEDPINGESIDIFINDDSVSFVSPTSDTIVVTNLVAEWLSHLPAKTALSYDYPSFWNTAKEYKELINFLIKESTGVIKEKLESQLRIFEEHLLNFQSFDTSCNIINILKHLQNVLWVKDEDKASIAGAQYNEIKTSFPHEVGNFFLPEDIMSAKTNYCKMRAAGILQAQISRLETLLEPSERQDYTTEEEFEEKINLLLQEMKKKYPIIHPSAL